MPNISKINALVIGSVSKVDGLAQASILDIDGITVTSAFTGLLDTYTGASRAYSVRQLKSGVTVAMRVRRDTAGGTGDDDEADVSFDTGFTNPTISLDSALTNKSAGVTAMTLGEFLNVGTVGGTTYTNPDSLSGTASCFVDEWKDQSGNANHATQVTFGSQPQIHSGTVNTDLITENGKPAVEFNGTSTYLNATGTNDTFSHYDFFMVRRHNGGVIIGTDNTQFWADDKLTGTSTSIIGGFDNTSSRYQAYRKNGAAAFTSTTTRDAYSASMCADDQLQVTINTENQKSGVYNFQLGAYQGPTSFFNGNAQEWIYWQDPTANLSSTDRDGIETDINTFFSIY